MLRRELVWVVHPLTGSGSLWQASMTEDFSYMTQRGTGSVLLFSQVGEALVKLRLGPTAVSLSSAAWRWFSPCTALQGKLESEWNCHVGPQAWFSTAELACSSETGIQLWHLPLLQPVPQLYSTSAHSFSSKSQFSSHAKKELPRLFRMGSKNLWWLNPEATCKEGMWELSCSGIFGSCQAHLWKQSLGRKAIAPGKC